MSTTTTLVMRRCLRKNSLLSRRSFGSAAAQLDYDDDDYQEENKNNTSETAMGDWFGVQWVIIGDRRRRHVYADRLSKILDVPHISMGSLVRQQLNPNSSLYKKIASAVNQGNLVPEDVIFSLLSKRLNDGYSRGESGFILDGIPRTILQAEILDQITDIDLVLNLKSTDDKTLLTNPIYSASRHYHSMLASPFNHPQESDNAVIKDKHRLNQEQKEPLEEYYKRQKKLLDFQVAAGAPGDTWEGLLAALHLRNTNVVTSANFSQKLTA